MNISFTTLEEAWGDDYKKLSKPKKQPKSNFKKEISSDILTLHIQDPHLANYFNKYADDYKRSYITEILHDYINKSSNSNSNKKNDVIFYLIGLLLIILLLDRIMD